MHSKGRFTRYDKLHAILMTIVYDKSYYVDGPSHTVP